MNALSSSEFTSLITAKTPHEILESSLRTTALTLLSLSSGIVVPEILHEQYDERGEIAKIGVKRKLERSKVFI